MNPIANLDGTTPLSTPSGEPRGEVERLKSLAAEFEALLLGQMLREMRSSMFEEGDESGFGGGPLADTVYTELSLALGRAGGFGMADAMLAPMSRQIISSGEGPATPAEAAAETPIELPTGRVTSGYGWRQHPIDGTLKLHKGTDIALPEGHEVPAVRGGRISFAGELPAYGKTVVVTHDSRVSTRYAHLSQIEVNEGDEVAQGQVLARSGSTGKASGPHLHFELIQDGRPVNAEVFGAPAKR